MDLIQKLLRSKNPTLVAAGMLALLLTVLWAGVGAVNSANAYIEKYETKEHHNEDIDKRVDGFRKDVRIAILENNAVLLDALDKKIRRAQPHADSASAR